MQPADAQVKTKRVEIVHRAAYVFLGSVGFIIGRLFGFDGQVGAALGLAVAAAWSFHVI
jgi:hypothetical protein